MLAGRLTPLGECTWTESQQCGKRSGGKKAHSTQLSLAMSQALGNLDKARTRYCIALTDGEADAIPEFVVASSTPAGNASHPMSLYIVA